MKYLVFWDFRRCRIPDENKNKPNISEKITNFKGETFKTPVFNFEKYKIWGLTLAFTINFLDLLDIKFDYDL